MTDLTPSLTRMDEALIRKEARALQSRKLDRMIREQTAENEKEAK